MSIADEAREKLPKKKAKPRARFPKSAIGVRAFETSVLRLLAIDMTPEQIAKKLNCRVAWVNKVAFKAEQGFKKLSSDAIDVLRGKEVALLEHLQAESLEAFEKSKEPRRVTVVEGAPDAAVKDADGNPKAKPKKIIQTTEHRAVGDARYLGTIVQIRERYAKVMGIDQPIELKHVLARYQEGRELIFTALRNVVGADSDLMRRLATEIERLESESTIAKDVAAS